VSAKGGAKPTWELYDVSADPGERNDVAAANAQVVTKLATSYDAWWASVRPALVNEKAIGPRLNPFKEMYWQQFGGGPSADELRIMEPTQTQVPTRREGGRKKQ
jgi:arylsulfatase